jgi:hypothetical protein
LKEADETVSDPANVTMLKMSQNMMLVAMMTFFKGKAKAPTTTTLWIPHF